MGKLLRHMRPFVWSILLIFVLLFGQAMADLSLPAYMADIVNVGIQQSGIENAVPRAIRPAEFEKLTYFMTEDEKTEAETSFRLLDAQALSTADYDDYVEEYPLLAEQSVYILATDDDEVVNRLNPFFGRAILAVSAMNGEGASLFGDMGAQVPEGVDPFALLSLLPASQLDTIRQEIDTRLDAISDDMLVQYAAAYLTEEYTAIGMDVKAIQFGYMFRIGGIMLLIALAGTAASITVGYLASRVAAAIARNMRLQLFRRVESFSGNEFDQFSTASLITRSTNDIQQIQLLLVIMFRIVFFAPIMGIGGIIKVVSGDAAMSWVIAAAVMALLALIGVMMIIAVPKFKIVQKLVDKVNLATREILSGLLVIRAFNTRRHEEAKFDKANTDLTNTNLFINRVMVVMMPTMMLIMNGVMILIVWVGGHQVDAGAMQVGDMMAFMQYTMIIIMSFLMLSMIFIMMPRAIVSAQRINEVLDTEPVIHDPVKSAGFPADVHGRVEFRDVSFRYPNAEEDVLKDISFVAEPGQTTAIIGSTGSGKSTLIHLIPRFYDVTQGKVLVDGVDVRDVTQHDLREKIGYVPQRSVLFSGTIGSNLRYADEFASDETLASSVKAAQADDFVTRSEYGLDTPVAQGGANFSGGQKQRLSIARALVRRPEVYIFDDSFSALDFKTDSAVRRALKKQTKEATVLIVTQRVSTVMQAEQIIVLDKGEIVGIGRHRKLMETCEVYREIAQSQLSQVELNS